MLLRGAQEGVLLVVDALLLLQQIGGARLVCLKQRCPVLRLLGLPPSPDLGRLALDFEVFLWERGLGLALALALFQGLGVLKVDIVVLLQNVLRVVRGAVILEIAPDVEYVVGAALEGEVLDRETLRKIRLRLRWRLLFQLVHVQTDLRHLLLEQGLPSHLQLLELVFGFRRIQLPFRAIGEALL